jgi:hypothetical protein
MTSRRKFIAVLGGAALAGAKVAAQSRNEESVFHGFHRSLLHVHTSLKLGLTAIQESVAILAHHERITDQRIAAFTEELLNHHKSEDSFFFPAFRSAGRLRSSDIAFLDARDREHHDVHRLCLELRQVALLHQRESTPTRTWRATVERAARELAELSRPHFAIEEATLTPTHLETLITQRELVAVYRDMGQNWSRR